MARSTCEVSQRPPYFNPPALISVVPKRSRNLVLRRRQRVLRPIPYLRLYGHCIKHAPVQTKWPVALPRRCFLFSMGARGPDHISFQRKDARTSATPEGRREVKENRARRQSATRSIPRNPTHILTQKPGRGRVRRTTESTSLFAKTMPFRLNLLFDISVPRARARIWGTLISRRP